MYYWEQNLLFTESNSNHVRICKLDGSDQKVVTLSFDPYDIVVYDTNQTIISAGSKGIIQFLDFKTYKLSRKKVGNCSYCLTSMHEKIWVENQFRHISEINGEGKILRTIKFKFSPLSVVSNFKGSLFFNKLH